MAAGSGYQAQAATGGTIRKQLVAVAWHGAMGQPQDGRGQQVALLGGSPGLAGNMGISSRLWLVGQELAWAPGAAPGLAGGTGLNIGSSWWERSWPGLEGQSPGWQGAQGLALGSGWGREGTILDSRDSPQSSRGHRALAGRGGAVLGSRGSPWAGSGHRA